MRIKWIKLRNIRSYSSCSLEFPEGSILLSGDIGAGKSTILLSIEFALFGFTSEINGETLLRNGKSAGSVELSFESDGKDITIKRSLKKKGSGIAQDSGYIIIDNAKEEKSADELKSAVLEILGYPQELLKKKSIPLYRYTVYTPQEDMKKILFESREERLSTIRKIFGIEKYGLVRANAVIIAASLRERARELSGKIYDLSPKREELSEKKRIMAALEKRINELSTELETAGKKVDFGKVKKKEAEENQRKFLQAKAQLESIEEMLSEKVVEIEKSKAQQEKAGNDIKALEKRISEKHASKKIDEESLEKSLEGIRKDLSALEKKHAEALERRKNLLMRKKELEKEISSGEELEKEVSEKEKELEKSAASSSQRTKFEKERDKIEIELKEIIAKKSEFSTVKSESERIISEISARKVCPTCRQEITEGYRAHIEKEHGEKSESAEKELSQLSKREEKLELLERELKLSIKALLQEESMSEKLRAEIKSAKERMSEIKKKEISLKEIGEGLILLEDSSSDEKIANLNREEEKYKGLLRTAHENNIVLMEKESMERELSQKIELLKKSEEAVSELKKSVGEINARKMKISSEIKGMRDSEKEFLKISSALEEIEKKEKELSILHSSLKSELDLHTESFGKLSKEVSEKEKEKEKCESIKETESMISEKFIGMISSIEKTVMSSVHQEFSSLFEEWFFSLVEEEQMSARLDDDFTPVIEQNGYETGIENLSGGEKTSIALAYRLALNKVINQMVSDIKTRDIIILDEPTDGFSSEQLDKVRTVLSELNVRQTIIVSHEAKIESFVDHIIRIAKQEHESRVF
ncbi:MAG: SMC family ATPase [Candidatus Woesearchaeota archaeon]|nr:SMC family ATPase [Candidatus Woesearchaeota archaeon]